MKKSKKSKQPLIASLALLAGCAVKISPGLLSLLGLMLAMGCASFWI